ncbi:MAG: glycosyltransferase family 2 protein, partial [Clostridium sp.]|nr:glycosyltransferase family 2 protein [Clostridium sp.]
NASEHLPDVLKSLIDFDEIVVCDMESTDNTVDISRGYGCKIVVFAKGENRICEPARNFAIQAATHEWVLVVDADEIVPDKLRLYLYDYISRDTGIDALAVSRINQFMGEEINTSPDYQLRFFKKQKTYWPPTIHSKPVINGVVARVPARRELSLLHLDNPTLTQRLNKLNVYSDYEVVKRKGKHFGIAKMIFRPMWFFLKSYLLNGGIKKGKKGVIMAYMDTVYQMMLLGKLTEAQMNSDMSQHS